MKFMVLCLLNNFWNSRASSVHSKRLLCVTGTL